MHVNVDKRNIEIGITDAHKELHGWVEIIGKTANKYVMIQIIIG
jgi:hypothetical protein